MELTTQIYISAEFTLDLNGHIISHTSDVSAVSVRGDGGLTVRDSGKNGAITSSDGYAVYVWGSLTLEGGRFSTSADNLYGVFVNMGATLEVKGEGVSIDSLVVRSGSSVSLTAGTYGKILIYTSTITAAGLLGGNCAYYGADGKPLALEELPEYDESLWYAALPGPVTVGECEHTGVSGVSNDDGTHTLTCPYCGYTGTADCTYDFSGNEGICQNCGGTLTVTVGTDELKYDGTEKEPTVTVKRGEQELTAGTDYTVTYANNKDAGDASVTVTIGKDRGTWTGTFTIDKATPAVTAPTAELYYGQRLFEAANINGAGVPGTWTWANPDAQPLEDGNTYSAAFTPDDTRNYETPEPVEVNVSVKDAVPKLTLNVPSYQIANEDVEVTYTVANPYDVNMKDNLPAVTLTYKIGNDVGVIGADGRFHIPEDTEKGTKITITAAAAAVNGKYTAASVAAEVEVTDKIPVEITGVSVTGRAYNGKAVERTGTPVIKDLDGRTVTDASVTYTWKTADGAAPVNAGDYTLEITVSGDKYIGKTEVDFTISKAGITVTADSLSAYAGRAKPTLTYTVDGLADGETLAAAPVLTCDADMNTIGQYPITASGGTVPAGGNYNPEITYVPGTLTVTAGKDVTILPNPPADVDGTKFQLVMETTISEVPEGLKDVEGLNTPEELIAAMKTAITGANSGVSQSNTAVYDVALMVSTDGGSTWVPATKDNFPSGGLTITLPYPAGTDSSYRFIVVHMFTTSDFGKQPGDTEIFTQEQVKNTADGIQVVVTGLSPISVGWEKGDVPVSPDVPVTPGVPSAPSGGGSSGGGSGKPSIVSVEKPEQDGKTDSVTNRFTDLGGSGTWYYDAVDFVLRNGLMKGYSSSMFGPNDNLSRAQLAQILYNKEGKPSVTGGSSFVDVTDGQWYASAITWAAANGIVNGYGNGRFGPNDNITREQLAVMLWRYAGSPAATDQELNFIDAGEASGYALEALRWAVENGVINGYGGGRLGPKRLATRAQVAQMLMNFLTNQ